MTLPKYLQTRVDEVLANPNAVEHPFIREMPTAVQRALDAGARPPFTYKGAGLTGIVLCDENNHAFKVARELDDGMLQSEAEWLEIANRVPALKRHVAEFYAYHPKQHVLERECVQQKVAKPYVKGLPYVSLYDVHRMIENAMVPHGWSAPEFKADSYVRSERGPVLVDAGFARRFTR